MKTIKAYEYKDLAKDVQKEVFERQINDEVEWCLSELERQSESGKINEVDFYKSLGCSKQYAETTSWFVPSCYYEKHKKEVDKTAKENLKTYLFNSNGRYLQSI